MVSLHLRVILLAELSYSCLTTSAINFKFYVTSGTDDWLISEQYPNGAYAAIMPQDYNWAVVPPETSWIWESPYIFGRTLTIIRYFFVPGKLVSATFIGAIDDTGSAKVNGGTSCTIPSYGSLYSCDFTSSILPGLNKLEITAIGYDQLAAAVYKLTLVSNIS